MCRDADYGLYGMGRPQQGHASKYCRLSGTGEDDTHLSFTNPQNRACSEQRRTRETHSSMSCRNEGIVFENRVATYANLVIRLRVSGYEGNLCSLPALSRAQNCCCWQWLLPGNERKIPLRGKRREVLSTDFLSMLLFFLWKCKSPPWRKAKTDFFYKLRHPRGCLFCVYIYFGCRISVLDNKKDAFASSCTTYCSPAEAVDSDHSYLNWPCNFTSCYYITTRTNVCQAIPLNPQNIFRAQSDHCIKTQKGQQKKTLSAS